MENFELESLTNDEIPIHKKDKMPKFKKSALVVFLLLLIVIVGSVYYFTTKTTVDAQDTPPKLEVEGSFQGFISTSRGMLKFEDTDVADFQGFDSLGCTEEPMPAGIHYYYSDRKLTFQGVIDRIKPELGNQLLIAFYSPGESSIGLGKGYYTYPVGPFDNTVLANLSYEIPAYRGFAVILKEETTGCFYDEKTEPDYSTFNIHLANDESGWILAPIANCSHLYPHEARLREVWPQAGENAFEEIPAADYETDCLSGDYHLSWLRLRKIEQSPYAGNFGQTTTTTEIFTNSGVEKSQFNPTLGESLKFFFNVTQPGEIILTILGPGGEQIIKSQQVNSDQINTELEFLWDGKVEDGSFGSNGDYIYVMELKGHTGEDVTGQFAVSGVPENVPTGFLEAGTDVTSFDSTQGGIAYYFKTDGVGRVDVTIKNITDNVVHTRSITVEEVKIKERISSRWDGQYNNTFAESGEYEYVMKLYDEEDQLVDTFQDTFQISREEIFVTHKTDWGTFNPNVEDISIIFNVIQEGKVKLVITNSDHSAQYQKEITIDANNVNTDVSEKWNGQVGAELLDSNQQIVSLDAGDYKYFLDFINSDGIKLETVEGSFIITMPDLSDAAEVTVTDDKVNFVFDLLFEATNVHLTISDSDQLQVGKKNLTDQAVGQVNVDWDRSESMSYGTHEYRIDVDGNDKAYIEGDFNLDNPAKFVNLPGQSEKILHLKKFDPIKDKSIDPGRNDIAFGEMEFEFMTDKPTDVIVEIWNPNKYMIHSETITINNGNTPQTYTWNPNSVLNANFTPSTFGIRLLIAENAYENIQSPFHVLESFEGVSVTKESTQTQNPAIYCYGQPGGSSGNACGQAGGKTIQYSVSNLDIKFNISGIDTTCKAGAPCRPYVTFDMADVSGYQAVNDKIELSNTSTENYPSTNIEFSGGNASANFSSLGEINYASDATFNLKITSDNCKTDLCLHEIYSTTLGYFIYHDYNPNTFYIDVFPNASDMAYSVL